MLTAAAISSAVVADGAGTLNRPPPQGPLTVAVEKLVQVNPRSVLFLNTIVWGLQLLASKSLIFSVI